MAVTHNRRPEPSEYDPYFGRYISLVEGDDILSRLGRQLPVTLELLGGISEQQANVRYAPGKWSLKEVFGHVLDFERIFGYRALLFARGEQTRLAGCDQDVLMKGAPFDDYRLSELATEFEMMRRANISFFRHLSEEAWARQGVANDTNVSVRALGYIIAGHELHHTRIIRERYL